MRLNLTFVLENIADAFHYFINFLVLCVHNF